MPSTQPASRSHAFSLVELSIVLVILGLLVGGVLSGQALIHAAELRAVSQEYSKYAAAVRTFRDKYFALPGDMNNATAFWGIAAGATGNDITCGQFISTNAKTCNGDGNGWVNYTATDVDESSRFWQQLANAGLIEGQYPGTYDSSNPTGVDPKSKFSGTVWWTWGDSHTNTAQTNVFDGAYGNYLSMSPFSTASGYGMMTPEDAWNVDTKMDDGAPATGSVVAYKGTASEKCTSLYGQTTSAGAVYNLSLQSKVCYHYYVRAY